MVINCFGVISAQLPGPKQDDRAKICASYASTTGKSDQSSRQKWANRCVSSVPSQKSVDENDKKPTIGEYKRVL